jgi:hypothetical protein
LSGASQESSCSNTRAKCCGQLSGQLTSHSNASTKRLPPLGSYILSWTRMRCSFWAALCRFVEWASPDPKQSQKSLVIFTKEPVLDERFEVFILVACEVDLALNHVHERLREDYSGLAGAGGLHSRSRGSRARKAARPSSSESKLTAKIFISNTERFSLGQRNESLITWPHK